MRAALLNQSDTSNVQFLAKGGEMGLLTREKNWRETEMGDPSGWPQSLKTTLSIILNSKFPMFLFWGEDAICFYNDAYRPSLGNNGKHPGILGKKGKEAWSEIWDVIGPQISGVLSGSEATWHEDMLLPIFRNGKIENVYWTYSYSPVKDELGEIAGVMVTCVETTAKVALMKEMHDHNTEFDFVINSANIATWELDPSTRKLTASKNRLNWFGAENNIPIENIFPTIAAESRQYYIDKVDTLLKGNQEYFEMEYSIAPESGEKRRLLCRGKILFENNVPVRCSGITEDITARYNAALVAKESDARFKNVVREAPVGIAILKGQNFIMELANRFYLDLIQRPESVIGKPLFEFLPEVREATASLLKKVLETGKPYIGLEFATPINLNGTVETRYYDFTYQPYKDDVAGEIVGVMVVCTDVTEKVKNRQEVEKNEKMLSLVIEASQLGTWSHDVEKNKAVFSDRLFEIFNVNKETNTPHKELIERIHPDDRHIREQALKEAVQTGFLNYTLRLLQPDTNVRWIQTKGKLIYDSNKKQQFAVGTVEDITDEKSLQQELENRELRFRTLANSMPQFVWTADEKGNVTYFNRAMYGYTGSSETDLLGSKWAGIIHPDDAEENIRAWHDAVEKKSDYIFEHRFRSKSGEYRWQLTRAIPLKNADGNVLMWVGTSTDINDIKKQEEERNAFIKMANHELKTPITNIKGYTQLLMKTHGNSDDPILKNSLVTINNQVNKLNELINDLLDISRIDTGTLPLHNEIFNMHELARDAIQDVEIGQDTHHISLKSGPGVIYNVFGDKDRMNQVILNLLTNAVKYSPGQKNVSVSLVKTDGKVILSVKDNGIGIDKIHQKHLFDRFFRVPGDSEKTFPGFGIGLYIVAEIVNRHGGEVWVDSEKGKGSTFFVSLPSAENTSAIEN